MFAPLDQVFGLKYRKLLLTVVFDKHQVLLINTHFILTICVTFQSHFLALTYVNKIDVYK